MAEDLSLPTAISQDWGIEHSDPRRFGEFAQYFAQKFNDLNAAARDQATDLVMQSAKEALEQGLRVNRRLFARFLAIAENAPPERVAYWRGLAPSGSDPWPITELL